jgi:hypothetical protein
MQLKGLCRVRFLEAVLDSGFPTKMFTRRED